MKTISVEIKGISSLLMHRFPEDDLEPKIKSKNLRSTEDDVEKSLYKLPDGTLYQPSTHLIGALKKAGAKFKVPGRARETFKNIIGSGAVLISPESIPHRIQEWEVDSRSVVIPSTKGRIIRKRPVLKNWALRFEVELDEDEVSPEALKEILDYAGRRVGLGDFRPDKGGPFGRFMVSRFN